MGSRRKATWGEDGWNEWGGYMNAKIQKLEQQYTSDLPKFVGNQSENEKSSIFRGVAIFVNGYTVPSADGLKRLMMLHGGVYHHYYRKTGTTHIIATNLATATAKNLTSEKIVKPEWITDSIKAGCLLPYQDYQLLYQKAKDQQQLPFTASKSDDTCFVSKSNPQKCDAQKESVQQSETLNSRYNSRTENGFHSTDLTNNESEDGPPSVNNSTNNKVVVPTCASVPSTSGSHSLATGTRTAMCATNSNFLTEFYGHSRLHYLSTMGAEFRDYVTQLRSSSNGSFPGRIRIKAWKARKRLMSKKMQHSDADEANISNLDAGTSTLAGKQRVIMHIDMDCFFVSVGIRDRPDLKGKPVVVTHSRGVGFAGQTNSSLRETEMEYYRQNHMRNSKSRPNSLAVQEALWEDQNEEELYTDEVIRSKPCQEEFLSSSEIACCSYEARQAGLRNGMFLGEAKKLCPNLQTISYNFEGYREVSYTLYDTVASYTHNIEAVSCDELYVDCTELLHEMEIGPLDFASILRKEILEKTRCTCSAGLSTNMLLARLATRRAKPNGQYFLSKDAADEFISQQCVKDLPGIGSSLSSRLKAMSVTTCGDLQKVTLSVLQKEFGPKMGQVLHNACRGIDDRQVKPEHHRKSVSAEVNYGIRFTKEEEVEKFIYELSEEVAKRLDSVGMKGKTLTLKLKVRRKDAPSESSKFMGHGICDSVTKSTSLRHPICEAARINQEVMTILRSLKVPPEDMRGVGIQMQRLESCRNNESNNATLLKFFQKPSNSAVNAEETDSVPSTSKNVASHLPNNTPISTDDVRQESSKFSNSLPPPSQVDHEVLSALPEDLRQQILEDYACRGVKLDMSSDLQSRGTLNSQSEESGEATGALLSVDDSFFEALPPDIQEEVKEMLQQQKNRLAHSPTKQTLQLLSSPEKHLKTPTKAVHGSPARRGRKPRSGTKKNVSPKTDAQQPKLIELLKGSRTDEHAVVIKPTERTDSVSGKKLNQKANLCGAVELQDVKQLIQEWVDSCPNPELEDVETIGRYLKGLIMERNLERVDLVAKFLYRVIVKMGNQEWRSAYASMLEDVQKLAVVLYDAPLKMSAFPTT